MEKGKKNESVWKNIPKVIKTYTKEVKKVLQERENVIFGEEAGGGGGTGFGPIYRTLSITVHKTNELLPFSSPPRTPSARTARRR